MSVSQQKTVVLGMSGGVDSSVAALLLQRKGYTVIGVFLKLYSETKNPLTGECSYLEDLRMARKIALLLGIELHVLDYEKKYKKLVLRPMFDAYRRGMTPNPDILCNKLMKFPLLLDAADKFKADYIATGHYACVKKVKGNYWLMMGKDRSKDQSYFLAELTGKALSHILFPVGNLTKQEVREIARKEGFPNWNKHGTVGICFVGKQNMQNFLKQKIKKMKGYVFSPEGLLLGTHQGVAYYTIGQKAGEHFGIVLSKPRGTAQKRWYVAKKNLRKNELIVAPEGHPCLKTKCIYLKDLHFLNGLEKTPQQLKVRIRHLGQLQAGVLKKRERKHFFLFSRSSVLPASGQRAVFYQGKRMVASAEIQ